MQRTRTLLRSIAALCLFLYLGGVAVAVVHAAERGPRGAETHVHGPKADCTPVHDEHHCPACHFAFGTPAELTAPWGLAMAPARRSLAAPDPRACPRTLPTCLSRARAPPGLA